MQPKYTPKLALGRVAITSLEKVFRCHGVTIPIKIKIVQMLIFFMTHYGRESWTLKKQHRKSIDTFGIWC